jgi:hypothetical protein
MNVAQIANLLFRRLAAGKCVGVFDRRRLPIGETAGCQPALLGSPR